VGQLIDEPKPVQEVGFIREREKVTARLCTKAQKPVPPCSDKGWGFYGHFNSWLRGLFSLAMHSQAFLGELICFALWGNIGGRGNNQRAFCSSALWQIYQTWYILFRM
jgi:hypothetical protein